MSQITFLIFLCVIAIFANYFQLLILRNVLLFFDSLGKLITPQFFLNFLNFLDFLYFHPQMSLFPVLGAVQRQIRWFERHIFGI